MIFALAALALAAEPPQVHLDIDATLGTRAGGSALVTADPVKGLGLGGYLSVNTVLYPMGPAPIAAGISGHSVRISPLLAAGYRFDYQRVAFAAYALAGIEVVSIHEDVQLAHASGSHRSTEVVFNGGLIASFRWFPGQHWGANALVFIPLPPAASGSINIERIHLGLGLSWRN